MAEREVADDPSGWGVRLSDRVRDAVSDGRFDRAVELVNSGDGSTRSLAKEYAMMIRGLGGTVRVIVALIEDPRFATCFEGGATKLVDNFRERYAGAAETALGWANVPGLTIEELLASVEQCFTAAQSRIAEDIADALVNRDVDGALQLLAEKEDKQFQVVHDELLEMMARAFDFAYRTAGLDGLEAFQMGVAEGQRSGFDAWEQLSTHDFVRAYAFLLKQHRSDLQVREDSDAWVIAQSYCGSGGRLIVQGRYNGHDDLSIVLGLSPVCGGLPELPVYCTHCAVWNGMAPEAWYGHAHIELMDPARPGGGCSLRIPKQP